MSRNARRQSVRKLVKEVIKSKEANINLPLPKEAIPYCKKEIDKYGRRK